MALDAGYVQFQGTLDLTGANSVNLGEANCPMDIYEIGVELVTASGADTLAVQFRDQAPPTGAAGGTQIGVVTGPAATIVAAGKCVVKKVTYRVAKGDRLWATVTDTTTGAVNARVFVKAYPAGESGAETNDIVSST